MEENELFLYHKFENMKDIEIYNSRMRKSMMDKIFFIDKVEAAVFIDFGCADGTMLKMLNSLFPEYNYIGYDNNPDMIKLAKLNEPSAHFFSDWAEVLKCIDENYIDKKKCLILSSILHEVEQKSDFFEFLGLLHFDYLAIRDMFFIESTYTRIDDLVEKILKSYYPENFETEIKEDYFSFNALHKHGLEHSYDIFLIYEYHYLLPYWKEVIKRDYEFDLTGIKTHVQLIYEIKK